MFLSLKEAFGRLKKIMNVLNIFPKHKEEEHNAVSSAAFVMACEREIKHIKIENIPFRLSGLLHILTNKLSELLQEQNQTIYYDAQRDVGRYIVGDNDYIEQVLEVLMRDALMLNSDSEVVLKISKPSNRFLLFEVINTKGLMHNKVYQKYIEAERIMSSQSKNLNSFIKAKKIAQAMYGTLELSNSKLFGVCYQFKIPYYKDEDDRNRQEALYKVLSGKRALFIGKDKYSTKRARYIFKTYGIKIDTLNVSEFETKKPNLNEYDMAILHSPTLTYQHISFFNTLYHDSTSAFKIIVMHELFESDEKIKLAKSIAHAELYNPTVIGDVEEILYQIFILKSHAVKGINNIENFNADTFVIKGEGRFTQEMLEQFRGAHIAVVEDSKEDEKIIRNFLTIEGVTLFVRHNGAEMLELLEEQEIDMIFTDLNMPVMDGILMTKKIRTIKKWETIPIISISSMAFPHELKEMQLAGMNAAIPKPIQAREVYTALEKFLVVTDAMRNRKVKEKKVEFSYDKRIIDFEKGLKSAQNASQYHESLLETMQMLEKTRKSFEEMIYNQELVALVKYSKLRMAVYEALYASEMVEMFQDLIAYIGQKQQVYLIDYIYIHQKKWIHLDIEVKRYIEHYAHLALGDSY